MDLNKSNSENTMSDSQIEQYLSVASEQAKFDHNTAKDMANNIPFQLHKDFIIKLLPAQKITVQVEIPVGNGKRDPETGAEQFDEIKVEDREIENPIVEAIILQIPEKQIDPNGSNYVLGEHILVSQKSTAPFYWFKDAYVVQSFNIIGRIRPEMVNATELDSKYAEEVVIAEDTPADK